MLSPLSTSRNHTPDCVYPRMCTLRDQSAESIQYAGIRRTYARNRGHDPAARVVVHFPSVAHDAKKSQKPVKACSSIVMVKNEEQLNVKDKGEEKAVRGWRSRE